MPDDMIRAPDGRTWYETALAEAEKRGRFQNALKLIEFESTDDISRVTARDALAGED